MYQIDRISLIPPIKNEIEQIRKAVAKRIRVDVKELTDVKIVKKSLDARKKPDLKYSYTVAFDMADPKAAQRLLKKNAKGQSEIRLYEPKVYPMPEVSIQTTEERMRPIVVGSGPAGLFCAYVLARRGCVRGSWNGARASMRGRKQLRNTGTAVPWIRRQTYSSGKAEPGRFRMEN